MKNITLICLALGAAMPAAAQEWENLSDAGKLGRIVAYAEMCKRHKQMTFGDNQKNWLTVIRQSIEDQEQSDFQTQYQLIKRETNAYDVLTSIGNRLCYELKSDVKGIVKYIEEDS